MNKKSVIKRITAFSLSAAIVLSLMGCGGKSGKAGKVDKNSALIKEQIKKYENVADVKEITDGVKLTVAVPSNAKVLDYNTNWQTQLIKEKLGAQLDFIELPSADYFSKLNVMVMGGEELPDIIFDPSGYTGWIEQGVVYDLSDLYKNDKFAANINAGVKRSGKDLVKYITRPEGGIYCIPKFNEEIFSSVRQKLWLYQPWLDAIGAKSPETLDEYYNICKKISKTDLNGNGKFDEVALTGTNLDQWFDCLMSSFVYAHDENWRLIKGGKISFAFTTNEWKNGLKYIKKFFDDGLIPMETLSQTSDQYKAIYYASVPTLFSFADSNYTGTDLNRRKEYTAVPALKGPSGAKNSCNIPTIPSPGAVITTDCENPLAAFIVCDYMCSEEMSISQRYGKQGQDWDYMENVKVGKASEFKATVEGKEPKFYPYNMIKFWNSTEAQSNSYRLAGPMILDMSITSCAAVWPGSSNADERSLAELELATVDAALACYKDQPSEVIDYAPLTVDETSEVTDIKLAILSYVKEMTASFLSGGKDIDSSWNGYISELENIGIKEYLKTLQNAYDRVHK